jgi:hypothetical protein
MTGFPSQIPPRVSSSLRGGKARGVYPPLGAPCHPIVICTTPIQFAAVGANRRISGSEPSCGIRHQFRVGTLNQFPRNACHYWRQYFRNVFHEMPPSAVQRDSQGVLGNVRESVGEIRNV